MSDVLAHKLSGALDLLAILEVGAICVLVALGITAAAAVIRALAPATAASLDAARAGRGDGRRLLLGLLNGPTLLLVSGWLFSHALGVLGLGLLAVLAALVLLGLVAELGDLGRRLLGRPPGTPPDLAAMLVGGALFSALSLLPVVGQAMLLAILLAGIGTAVSSLLGRRA